MSNIKVLSINYEESDTIECQGKKEEIKKYLNDGYGIIEDRNGYWVLSKSARIKVMIDDASEIKELNMKREVCDHYERSRISEVLANKFKEDIYNGSIIIVKDLSNNYLIN